VARLAEEWLALLEQSGDKERIAAETDLFLRRFDKGTAELVVWLPEPGWWLKRLLDDVLALLRLTAGAMALSRLIPR
jgi:hypothetical protein